MKKLTYILETLMKANSRAINLSPLSAVAIFAALVLICGPSARAAEFGDVRQVVVQFGDLNLSNPQGAVALYRRIAAAANDVCGAHDVTVRTFGYRASVDACVHKAISGAVTKVGRTELVAIYNAKYHQPVPVALVSAQAR
ncbi:MAG TPA: UrcA family protein [Steroidobacteraceae bacterium]|nr:UrcA family protein [Steroidobacteraceae bacterium]